MDPEIKRLSIRDYEAIIKIWSDAGLPYKPRGRDSRDRMEREMAFDGAAFFGLYYDHRMVGVGIANWDGRRGWINRVAIDPEYRGQRLAGHLILACEEFLREKGALVICALIEDLNTPSMQCFENEGYVCMPDVTYWSKRSSIDD